MDYGVAAGKRVSLGGEGGQRMCEAPCEAGNQLAHCSTARNNNGLCWYRRPSSFPGQGYDMRTAHHHISHICSDMTSHIETVLR